MEVHFKLYKLGWKRAFKWDDLQKLRILNKVECSSFKGDKGNLVRRNYIFSTTFSELPVQYGPHDFPLVVCNLLSENEILCQVFNFVIPNAS